MSESNETVISISISALDKDALKYPMYSDSREKYEKVENFTIKRIKQNNVIP